MSSIAALEKGRRRTGNAAANRGSHHAFVTLGRLFSGMTFPQVWKKTLKDVKAAAFDDPEAEAAALDADLICGGSHR